ncbi:MAG: DUF6580 family putative transport protein [Bacteroidia bacterium]
MQNKINLRTAVLIILMLGAALSRMIPHPYNFAPIGALGLFGAAYFSQRWLAILLPLISLWISDIVINNTLYAKYYNGFTIFYDEWYWIYGTLALTSVIGFYTLKTVNVKTVLGSSLIASALFFLLTNFACWPGNNSYSQNLDGLMQCYAAGVPFFKGTLAGNLFYSALLFGGFELAKKNFPLLQPA